MGGPVTIMWDIDLAKLEHVGQVPMGHLANARLDRPEGAKENA
jgi:hypothetical protein